MCRARPGEAQEAQQEALQVESSLCQARCSAHLHLHLLKPLSPVFAIVFKGEGAKACKALA